MHKGFYTVSIAIAALFPLLLLTAAGLAAHSAHSSAAGLAASLIAKKEAQLDFKHAVAQVLANSRGESAEQRLAATYANLAAAELLLEREHAVRGVSLDAWVGVMTPGERQRLAAEMVVQGRPLKCRACLDLSAAGALDGLVFYNGSSSVVSRKGGAQSQSRHSLEAGVPAIGCSIFVNGVSGTCGVWQDGFD